MKENKVILFGNDSKAISRQVKTSGFIPVKSKADFVISYGGDGTLMRAEHKFPGIPKIILKGSLICKRCLSISNEEILRRMIQGRFKIDNLMKLAIKVGAKKLSAINDIIIHNEDPRHAIRYYL